MRLQPGDVGSRVTVRHRLPDGRATDVIGHLLTLDEQSLVVRHPERGDVRVLVEDVVDGRVVAGVVHGGGAARAGQGREGLLSTPVTVAAARTALGWPARSALGLGDWLLRSGPAAMMRGRSALVAGDPGLPLRAALDAVVDHYRGLGLTPAVQVSSALPGRRHHVGGGQAPGRRPAAGARSAELEELLAASGWTPTPWTVLALRDPARRTPGASAAPVSVDLAPSPSASWLAASDHHGSPMTRADLPPERDGVAPAYATARPLDRPGEVAGVARGALAQGWLGVTCVNVHPDRRRRGVATALLAAVEDGLGAGAGAVYVQVAAEGHDARAAWRSLGFTDHSRYRYWTLPDR